MKRLKGTPLKLLLLLSLLLSLSPLLLLSQLSVRAQTVRLQPIPLPANNVGIVTSNAALIALPTASGETVYRSGFYNPGDGGNAYYSFSVTPCTLNSGAGDNGAQVASSGGGCWNAAFNSNGVDARVWGATCGTGDSTSALNAAETYFRTTNGGTILIQCPMTVAGMVTLGRQNQGGVTLQGVGPVYFPGMLNDNYPGNWPPTAGPALNCTSTTATYCIKVAGQGIQILNLNVGNPLVAPPTNTVNWSPTIYPYIIGTDPNQNWAGLGIYRITCTATSQCIDLEGSPGYNTVGIAGTQYTVKDIWCNPCLNEGIMFHHLDSTGEVDNIEYDYWWNRANPVVAAYTKTHSIGMTWRYVANVRFNGLEFFSNYKAIDQINDTVTGGFGATFAANVIQGTNISFNEVCQAMGNESGSALISSGSFTNVTLYQDTTQNLATPPATHYCAQDSVAAIDLSSSGNANWTMSPMKVGIVETVAAVGPNSTLHLDMVDIMAYSHFAAGAPAFKVSAGADFSLGSSLKAALRPDSTPLGGGSAGKLLGPGLDSTQGYEQAFAVGGSTNCSEGAVQLRPSGNRNSGYVEFFPCAGGVAPSGGGGGSSGRNGYVGFSTGLGVNLAADNGAVFIKPNSSDTSAPVVNFNEDASHHNLVNVSPLPTTPPSGTSAGRACIDTQGNLWLGTSC